MTIDAYLAKLEPLLPRTARLRALPEVREHLRDAAARHRSEGIAAFDAEAAATSDFGRVEDVARRLGSELAVRETRLAGALALGAVAFFVFPLYVVPENTLPPAPWVEKPRDILVLQLVAIGLWIAAGVLAATGEVLAWTRWSRLAAPVLFGTAVAVTGSLAVSVVLVVRWFALTPATPSWALAAPPGIACLVLCAGAAGWAHTSRRRLVLQD
ncbi:MAG: hypothetical protein H0U08_09990 [Actinobacteria bacterium]|nr:hypothetical protein [Actinomycetota bacterium]